MSQHHTTGRQGQGSRRRPHRNGGNSKNRRDYHGRRNNNQRHGKKQEAKVSFFQRMLQVISFGAYSPGKKEISKGNKKVKQQANPTRDEHKSSRTERRPQSPKKPQHTPRLYVGNLSYLATESDLEDLFKGVGAVRAVEIIYNPRTHKSKGYAFIEMQFMDDAIRAVEVLHDQPFLGRPLTVSAANERQESSNEDARDAEQNFGMDPDDPDFKG